MKSIEYLSELIERVSKAKSKVKEEDGSRDV